MNSGNVRASVVLAVLCVASGCKRNASPEAAASSAPTAAVAAAPPPVPISLEIDEHERGTLTVSATPVALARLVPKGVKPLPAWKRIHVESKSRRFVLVTEPAREHPGWIPALFLDRGGQPVFAMVEGGPQGELPERADALKRTMFRLAGVAKVHLRIDFDPSEPARMEGEIVLRRGNRIAPMSGSALFEMMGEAAPRGGSDVNSGSQRADAPLGWNLARVLRDTVLRGEPLTGLRVIDLDGGAVDVDPTWWTEEGRLLALKVNQRGEFVIHGYRLGDAPKSELELRRVATVDANPGAGGRKEGEATAEHRKGTGSGGGTGPGGRRGAGTGDGSGRKRSAEVADRP